jgi:hypothetical protein
MAAEALSHRRFFAPFRATARSVYASGKWLRLAAENASKSRNHIEPSTA